MDLFRNNNHPFQFESESAELEMKITTISCLHCIYIIQRNCKKKTMKIFGICLIQSKSDEVEHRKDIQKSK